MGVSAKSRHEVQRLLLGKVNADEGRRRFLMLTHLSLSPWANYWLCNILVIFGLCWEKLINTSRSLWSLNFRLSRRGQVFCSWSKWSYLSSRILPLFLFCSVFSLFLFLWFCFLFFALFCLWDRLSLFNSPRTHFVAQAGFELTDGWMTLPRSCVMCFLH